MTTKRIKDLTVKIDEPKAGGFLAHDSAADGTEGLKSEYLINLALSLAPKFDAIKANGSDGYAYHVNDPVVYLGRLYRFIADKAAGAWDATKVTAVDVETLLGEKAAKAYGTDEIANLPTTATDADLVPSNYLALDGNQLKKLPAELIEAIPYKQIFGNFNNTIGSLNNLKYNRTYIVQRTSATTVTDFPSDFPADSGMCVLEIRNANYTNTKYNVTQKLTKLSTGKTWYRSYNSDGDTWSDWKVDSLGNMIETALNVNEGQIFGNFNNALGSLNNLKDNRIYLVQRTSATTVADFPSDFPIKSDIGTLTCIKANYTASKFQVLQILEIAKTSETWYRSYNSDGDTWSDWKFQEKQSIIRIGTAETYTTLRSGIAAAIARKNTYVYVVDGNYDLTSEFAEDISSTMPKTGIELGNGVHVFFADGVKVTANFDNTGGLYDAETWRKIYDNFNPFYAGDGDFTLENLNIEAKNTRYCVHDEKNGLGTYTHKFLNCKMKYTNEHTDMSYVQCIGGGLGLHGAIVIDGGYYETETNKGFNSIDNGNVDSAQICISFHNGNNADAESSIVVKNVYCANRGYMRFTWYGPSASKTSVAVNGCSFGLPILERGENSSSVVDNMELIEWQNEKRNDVHWSFVDAYIVELAAD